MNSDSADTPPPVDTYGTDSDARSRSEPNSKPIVNALIGGGVGIVLSFIPGSTVLGGAIAGYLEGSGSDNALQVGALAGLVMAVPHLLFGLFVLWFLGVLAPGVSAGTVAVLVVGVAVYTVVLSIVGAYVGIALESEL